MQISYKLTEEDLGKYISTNFKAKEKPIIPKTLLRCNIVIPFINNYYYLNIVFLIH